MCFKTSKNEKTLFLGIKSKKLETRKTEIFSKGLDHGLLKKLVSFSCCYFSIYRPGKFV